MRLHGNAKFAGGRVARDNRNVCTGRGGVTNRARAVVVSCASNAGVIAIVRSSANINRIRDLQIQPRTNADLRESEKYCPTNSVCMLIRVLPRESAANQFKSETDNTECYGRPKNP